MSLFSRKTRLLRAIVRVFTRYIFGKRGQRRVHALRLFYRLRVEILVAGDDDVVGIARAADVRIWVDGIEAFPRLEQLIRRARHAVVVQMFLWRDDGTGKRIASLLVEAADRGIRVDVTKESVGDMFEVPLDFLGTRTSNDIVWQRFWSHPRIAVHYVKHNDHAKVFVIDNQILVLTGMNIADEYRFDWHDYMVELRGEDIVRKYMAREDSPFPSSTRLIMNTEDRCEIRPVTMHLLHSAQSTIEIEHCYLSDPEVVDTLIEATKRGVRVTAILPARKDIHDSANMFAVGKLLAECHPGKIQVFLFPRVVHGKIVLVDRSIAFLGSANLMKSSLDDMGEVNVLIEGARRREIRKLIDTFSQDLLMSRPVSSPPHLAWLARVLAWLWM